VRARGLASQSALLLVVVLAVALRPAEWRVALALGIAVVLLFASLVELHTFRCPRCDSPFVRFCTWSSSVLDLFRRRCLHCNIEAGTPGTRRRWRI
jgi:hypothetical protein